MPQGDEPQRQPAPEAHDSPASESGPARPRNDPATGLVTGAGTPSRHPDVKATMALAELHADTEPDTVFENEGAADWQCDCCEEPVRIPRGSTVVHGDFQLQYSAFNGLTVNGETVDVAY